MDKTLTVVMPTFNGERYIPQALESLTGPHRPDEVIVVDDGSTDATLDIAKSFVPRLPLRILRPTPRRSWTAMTNIGLSAVRSEWTAILHQDDMWLPGRRQSLEPILESDVDMVISNARYIDEAGRPLGLWRIPAAVRRRPERLPAALYVQNWLSVPATTFRTEAALAVGGLDEALWYTADWDLWLKLSKKRLPALAIGAGAAFRVHAKSQTVTGSRDGDDLRAQLNVVQSRHQWATYAHPRPAIVRTAGKLSTETNVALASAMHGSIPLRLWFDTARRARLSGTVTFVRHSAIADRLAARLRAKTRGRLISVKS